MPVHNFPFIKPTEKFQRAKPWLAIRLTNRKNNRSCRTFGLIDCGADHTTLPMYIAEQMRCDLPKRGKRIQTAGGLATVYTYDDCKIEILDSKAFSGSTKAVEDLKVVDTIENVSVDFAHTVKNPLLGVDGFLEHFVLEINYHQMVFSLR